MERQMTFLREFRQALLSSSSYSTARACVILLVFALLAINCGPVPKGQYDTSDAINNTASNETITQSTEEKGSLPESATIDLQKMPYITKAFKVPPRVRSRRPLDDFQLKMRERRQHSAIVTNCTFDVLKSFVAKEWAPIVIIQLQGRTPVILSVTKYDNRANVVHLHNPANLNKRQLTYEEFETAWAKDTRKRCLLITPQQLTEADVKKALGQYLSTETFQEISVRSY